MLTGAPGMKKKMAGSNGIFNLSFPKLLPRHYQRQADHDQCREIDNHKIVNRSVENSDAAVNDKPG